MKYLGGKHRQGKKIAEIILPYLKNVNKYIEPFCGAMGVACRMIQYKLDTCEFILSDNCYPLMRMWEMLIKEEWSPPDVIDKELYQNLHQKNDPNDPMTAYCGFGMSFAGKLWKGYTKQTAKRNYAMELKKSTLLKANILSKANVVLNCCDYHEYEGVKDAVFYLDPPYFGRTKQSHFEFDHEEFWIFTRRLSKNNIVFITEFTFPDDFKVIYNFGDTVVRHHSGKGKDGTCEYLITMIGGVADESNNERL